MIGSKVELSDSDGVAVARVSGEIDIANSTEVARSILAEVSGGARGVVLDLSELEYIDSTGVRMLFDVSRRLAATRRPIALFLPTESPVRRLFELVQVSTAGPVCASLQSAIEHIDSAINETLT